MQYELTKLYPWAGKRLSKQDSNQYAIREKIYRFDT